MKAAATTPEPPGQPLAPGKRRVVRGFTLIELMVALAIAVLLMVVAVPSFVQFRRNAELSDAVSAFIMSAGAAKTAALKSGHNAFMRVDNTTQGWRSGWSVFVDRNGDNLYSASDEVVMRREPLSADITATATGNTMTAGYLMFTGSGFPRVQGSSTLIDASSRLDLAITGRTTRIHVGTEGRLRACKVGDAGC